MKKQQGFAHAILIIGMAVALLGALGFIFWQNFIYEEPVAKEVEFVKTTPQKVDSPKEDLVDNKVFSNKTVTFEYPSSGWVVKESKSQYANDIARIETTDYKENIGIGLASGASLSIVETTEDVSPPQAAGVKNVEEIDTQLGKGYKYEISYEGYRLQAKLLSKGLKLIITMETTGKPTSSEKDAFNLVLDTLSLK